MQQVHLCCGDKSLGGAQVPFSSLLVQDTTAIDRHPLMVEGGFRLVPPALVQHSLPPVMDASKAASVGMVIALRREEMPLPQSVVNQVSSTAKLFRFVLCIQREFEGFTLQSDSKKIEVYLFTLCDIIKQNMSELVIVLIL